MPSTQSETMDSVRFAESVDPNDEVQLSYEVPQDATIERVEVRIYRGAELDLHVVPWHNPGGGRDDPEPLVTFEGKQFVDGDSDHWQFQVAQGVTEGDEIGATLTNTSSESDGYTLDAAVNVTLDTAGGTSRFGGLFGVIRGWL